MRISTKIVPALLAAAILVPSMPVYADEFMPRSQEQVQAEQNAANSAYLEDMERIAMKRPSVLSSADFALRAYALGNTELAKEYAGKSLQGAGLKHDSARVIANFVLSLASLDDGNADAAVKYAESAVAADADDWRGYYALAIAYEKMYSNDKNNDMLFMSIHNYLETASRAGDHPSYYVGKRLATLAEGKSLVQIVGGRDARRVLDITSWSDGNYLGDYLDAEKLEVEKEARKWCLKHHPNVVRDSMTVLY